MIDKSWVIKFDSWLISRYLVCNAFDGWYVRNARWYYFRKKRDPQVLHGILMDVPCILHIVARQLWRCRWPFECQKVDGMGLAALIGMSHQPSHHEALCDVASRVAVKTTCKIWDTHELGLVTSPCCWNVRGNVGLPAFSQGVEDAGFCNRFPGQNCCRLDRSSIHGNMIGNFRWW